MMMMMMMIDMDKERSCAAAIGKGKKEEFRTVSHLRQHIVLSTPTGRAVHVDHIRDRDERPACGYSRPPFCGWWTSSRMDAVFINETGTTLKYKPTFAWWKRHA